MCVICFEGIRVRHIIQSKSNVFNNFYPFSLKGEETQQESYKYLTVDEMKSLGDDSMPIDVTHDEGMKKSMDRSTEYPTNVSVS